MKIEVSGQGPIYIKFSDKKVAVSQAVFEGKPKIIVDTDSDGETVGIEIV